MPSDSEAEFREFIATGGGPVASMRANDAVRFALQFYREVRADDCPLDDKGDMLLYQWGVYDWGDGETFNFDITRQFILSDSEGDEGMSQLNFTLHFAPADNLRALKGNRWCHSPAEIDALRNLFETVTHIEQLPLLLRKEWSLPGARFSHLTPMKGVKE